MINSIIFISLLMIYLGLAGFFGALLRSTTQQGRIYRVIFLCAVLIPFSIILPCNPFIKVLAWVMAALVIILVYRQYSNSLQREWFNKIALMYFGILMLVVSAWALFSGISFTWIYIGIPALLASIFCWVKLNHVNVI